MAIGLARHACYQTQPPRWKCALYVRPLAPQRPLPVRRQKKLTRRWAVWLLPLAILLIGLLRAFDRLASVTVGLARHACYQTQPLRRKNALYAIHLGDISYPSVISFFSLSKHCCCCFHYHHRCNNVVFTITSTCTFIAEVVAYQAMERTRGSPSPPLAKPDSCMEWLLSRTLFCKIQAPC